MTFKHSTPLLCERDGDTWTTTWREFARDNADTDTAVAEVVDALLRAGEWSEHCGPDALKVRVAR